MAGLGPPIHDFDFGVALKSWMPAPSAGMTSVRETPNLIPAHNPHLH